jgi:hypothetical protein
VEFGVDPVGCDGPTGDDAPHPYSARIESLDRVALVKDGGMGYHGNRFLVRGITTCNPLERKMKLWQMNFVA